MTMNSNKDLWFFGLNWHHIYIQLQSARVEPELYRVTLKLEQTIWATNATGPCEWNKSNNNNLMGIKLFYFVCLHVVDPNSVKRSSSPSLLTRSFVYLYNIQHLGLLIRNRLDLQSNQRKENLPWKVTNHIILTGSSCGFIGSYLCIWEVGGWGATWTLLVSVSVEWW